MRRIVDAHQSELFNYFAWQTSRVAHFGFGAKGVRHGWALVKLRSVQGSAVPYGTVEIALNECAVLETRTSPIRILETAFDKSAKLKCGNAAIIT